jgi:hypothetical protein
MLIKLKKTKDYKELIHFYAENYFHDFEFMLPNKDEPILTALHADLKKEHRNIDLARRAKDPSWKKRQEEEESYSLKQFQQMFGEEKGKEMWEKTYSINLDGEKPSISLEKLNEWIIDEHQAFIQYSNIATAWKVHNKGLSEEGFVLMALQEETHRDFIILLKKTLYPTSESINLGEIKEKDFPTPLTKEFMKDLMKDEMDAFKEYHNYIKNDLFFEIMSYQEHNHYNFIQSYMSNYL